ncbi:MAG: FAD-dependent oxidoreductase, partial [Candidatus Geothermincolales bacterium]
SFSSFLRGYGLRDELYGLLSGLAEVWGIPAERLPAIIGCFLLSDLFMDGIYVPTAGFSSLAREMAKMTHLAGGRVVVQAPVEQVKAKRGDGGPFTVRFRGGELESRAVVFGLIQEGGRPFILNRTPEKAQALAQAFGCPFFPWS